MKPNEIKAALMLKNIRQTDIARRLKLRQSTVNDVIAGRGKSARVQNEVAKLLEKPVEEIFPHSA